MASYVDEVKDLPPGFRVLAIGDPSRIQIRALIAARQRPAFHPERPVPDADADAATLPVDASSRMAACARLRGRAAAPTPTGRRPRRQQRRRRPGHRRRRRRERTRPEVACRPACPRRRRSAPACLDARSGRSASTSDATPADGASDATPADATPADVAADTTVAPDASALAGTPLGAWTHETIGDCIHVIERLEFDPTATVASWLEQDRNFCSNPQTDVTHLAVASVPDDHVVELAFGADLPWPSEGGAGPGPFSRRRRTTSTASPRPPSGACRATDRWRRDDQEIRGLGDQRYDRHLVFEVTLEGFPT
ncbi:MAG: hypothetical protein U1F43_32655 [Myxococcota bacterium]